MGLPQPSASLCPRGLRWANAAGRCLTGGPAFVPDLTTQNPAVTARCAGQRMVGPGPCSCCWWCVGYGTKAASKWCVVFVTLWLLDRCIWCDTDVTVATNGSCWPGVLCACLSLLCVCCMLASGTQGRVAQAADARALQGLGLPNVGWCHSSPLTTGLCMRALFNCVCNKTWRISLMVRHY